MQRFLFVVLLLCIFKQVTFSQSSAINGKLTDEHGQVVEFASLVLLKLPDSSQVSSQISNEKGEFKFHSVHKGKYVIAAVQVGYLKTYSEPLSIDGATSREVTLVMKVDAVSSQEVIIEAQKPLVRQEPDKMVVDVENQVSSSGLTAQDLLRKSPGVTLDKDGKINLRGKSGVLVMLDDKPLYMSESQISNLLKSIPSDQIKEIELITSPSAKYDALGSAGIVNIKLKKGAYEGLTGTFNSSLGHGQHYKANSGINISYKKKKISLNVGYQYNNKKELGEEITNRSYIHPSNPLRDLNSQLRFNYNEQAHNVLLNGQYKINDSHSFNYDFNNSYSSSTGRATGSSLLVKKDELVKSSSSSTDTGESTFNNFSAGAGYQAKLDTNGTSLSVATNYNQSSRAFNRKLWLDNYDSLNQNLLNPFLFDSKNLRTISQYSAKVDFTKNIFSKIKFETGAKFNHITNDIQADNKSIENHIHTDVNDLFLYKEDVYAGYGIINKKWEKWKVQIGMRLEHTSISGKQYIIDSSFTRSYTNLFPSGNLSYSPTKNTSYTLMYSRRIKRPEAYHLNPMLYIQDPYTSWGGNPFVLPQFSDNYELAHSMMGGKVITTLSYSHNIKHISYSIITDERGLKTRGTFLNMKSRDMVGVSVAINTSPNKWWTTSNFVNVFYTDFVGGQGFETANYSQGGWTANSTQTFKLPKEFTLEVSGNYESPKAQNAFGINLEVWQANVGLSKKVWGGKGILKFAATDMFWSMRWATKSTINNTIIISSDKSDTRVVMFTFTYKFGNKVSITKEG